jgi:hypothetical protein
VDGRIRLGGADSPARTAHRGLAGSLAGGGASGWSLRHGHTSDGNCSNARPLELATTAVTRAGGASS